MVLFPQYTLPYLILFYFIFTLLYFTLLYYPLPHKTLSLNHPFLSQPVSLHSECMRAFAISLNHHPTLQLACLYYIAPFP